MRSAHPNDRQFAQDFGARVRALRLARKGQNGRKLTQDEVANAIGVSRSTLASIEKGIDAPGRGTMFAILNFYGQPMDDATTTAALLYGPASVSSGFVDHSGRAELLDIWDRIIAPDRRELALNLLRHLADKPSKEAEKDTEKSM